MFQYVIEITLVGFVYLSNDWLLQLFMQNDSCKSTCAGEITWKTCFSYLKVIIHKKKYCVATPNILCDTANAINGLTCIRQFCAYIWTFSANSVCIIDTGKHTSSSEACFSFVSSFNCVLLGIQPYRTELLKWSIFMKENQLLPRQISG